MATSEICEPIHLRWSDVQLALDLVEIAFTEKFVDQRLRPEVAEEVESLGAEFVELDLERDDASAADVTASAAIAGIIGAVTFWGSLVAAGKLHGYLATLSGTLANMR